MLKFLLREYESRFSEYFGLTEEEIEQSLKDYGIEYKLEEIQTWYNGYNFVSIV